MEYIENGPFPYNNFIYKAALDAPATAASFKSAAHCVVQPPSEGVTSLIVRLSNPRAMGLNNANRVQNEVAAMHLARRGRFAHLVPAVYAWQAASNKVSAREDCPGGEDVPAEADFGWILMECMPGVPLDEAFKKMQWREDKMRLVDDVAAIYAAWQAQQLPPGADCFGGLTFDDEGGIISGQPTVQEVPAGPWRLYADVWVDTLKDRLVEADNSSALRGWKDGDLRDRVDAFVARVGTVLDEAGVEPVRTLVHTDFSEFLLCAGVPCRYRRAPSAVLDSAW